MKCRIWRGEVTNSRAGADALEGHSSWMKGYIGRRGAAYFGSDTFARGPTRLTLRRSILIPDGLSGSPDLAPVERCRGREQRRHFRRAWSPYRPPRVAELPTCQKRVIPFAPIGKENRRGACRGERAIDLKNENRIGGAKSVQRECSRQLRR